MQLSEIADPLIEKEVSTFSLASFQSTELVYPQLVADKVYVQKPYDQRELPLEEEEVENDFRFSPTAELLQIGDALSDADNLRERPKEKNWIKGLFRKAQKLVGDRTPKQPIMSVNSKDYYHKYFNAGYVAKNPLSLNPEYTSPEAHLLKRAMCIGASAKVLAGSGLLDKNATQLSQIGLMLMDFRINRRKPNDMKVMFSNVNALKDAGFTSKSFDSVLWSLPNIAKAYNVEIRDLIDTFAMQPSDILAAGMNVQYLQSIGVNINHLVDDPNIFNIVIASKMKPSEFLETFSGTKETLFYTDHTPIFTAEKMEFLSHVNSWNLKELQKIGLSKAEIDRLYGKESKKKKPH